MVNATWMNRRQLCRVYAQNSADLSDLRRRIRSFMFLRGITVDRAAEDITREYNLRQLEMTADSSLGFLIEEARWLRMRFEQVKKVIMAEFKDDTTYNLILSIPGFGEVTLAYLTSMIVDIDRFDSPSQFAAHFRIVPEQRESADKSKKCEITRRGDDTARNMLTQQTFRHITTDRDRLSNVSRMYDRIRARGMPHKKALTACANKIAHIMFSILKNREPYRV